MAEIKYLDLNGLKALYGVVDSKIKVETDRATAAEDALSNKIKAMALPDSAVSGEFVTAVHQTDGKVTIERGGVSASMVTATNVEVGAGTVAITGANVEEQIKSLGRTLKTVEGNAAKYEVEEVTTGLPANVRTRYQVVSYVGTKTDTNKTKVGEYIDIPKDGQLINVVPTKNGQGIIFTYSTGDGGIDKTITIDLGKAIFESEIGSGLQVNDSVVSVKLAEGNESFLTVSADGIKLAGVQKAIDDAVAAKNVSAKGDAYINASATGNTVNVSADVHPLTVNKSGDADSTIAGVEKSLVDGKEVADKVASFTNARISEEISKLDSEKTSTDGVKVAVKVTEVDGKISAVNVTETDIASDAALTTEINRATGAEDKIEASVGLTADGSFTAPAGNYINGAATVMDAVEKLDVQAKANADKIDGMSVDEVNKTVTIGSKSLKFVAFTAKEIVDAANSAAGK